MGGKVDGRKHQKRMHECIGERMNECIHPTDEQINKWISERKNRSRRSQRKRHGRGLTFDLFLQSDDLLLAVLQFFGQCLFPLLEFLFQVFVLPFIGFEICDPELLEFGGLGSETLDLLGCGGFLGLASGMFGTELFQGSSELGFIRLWCGKRKG